jgi:hypothetical protein
MCFETSKTAMAKVAKSDIECWKAVYLFNGKILSACEDFEYVKNIIQLKITLEKHQSYSFGWEIRYGYHSCKSLKEAKSWPSYLTVKKFIIPKGTLYFSNRREYVSETIILKS